MNIYLRLYICIYLHICNQTMYIWLHMYLHKCTYMYKFIHIYTHIHIYIHTYMDIHTCIFTHTYKHTHTHICAYIYQYTDTHIYMHISGRGRLHLEFACALSLHVFIRCARAPSTRRLSQNQWFTFNVAQHQKFERCAISAHIMLRTIACLCVLVNSHNISLWRCATQHVCECL